MIAVTLVLFVGAAVVVVVMPIVFVVVVKAMVCAGAVIDTLVEVLTIDVRADVLINAVDAVETTLEIAVSVLYSVDDVLSNVAFDSLMDTFASVLVVIMIDVLSGIDVDALVDVKVNAFAGLMTLDFPMSVKDFGF